MRASGRRKASLIADALWEYQLKYENGGIDGVGRYAGYSTPHDTKGDSHPLTPQPHSQDFAYSESEGIIISDSLSIEHAGAADSEDSDNSSDIALDDDMRQTLCRSKVRWQLNLLQGGRELNEQTGFTEENHRCRR